MRTIDADALLVEFDRREAEPEYQHEGEDWHCGLISGEELVMEAPTVEPERKKGKWIPHRETSREYIGTTLIHVTYDYWFCDTCGYRVENVQPTYNFCPSCGADMRGEQE